MSKDYEKYLENAAFERGVNLGAGGVGIVVLIIFGLIVWLGSRTSDKSIRQIVEEKYASPATYITLEANYTNATDKVATLNRLVKEVESNGYSVLKIDSDVTYSTVNCIRIQGKK